MTITEDQRSEPMFRPADVLPLGRGTGLVELVEDMPTLPGVRTFGLGFATSGVAPLVVDVSGLRYDAERQLSVDDAGVAVFGKHSTGETNTKTSDGHQSMDSDTDHTED